MRPGAVTYLCLGFYRSRPFSETTRQLLNSVIVIYSELFRTRNVLDSLRGASMANVDPGIFRGKGDVHQRFQEAWVAHNEFCMDWHPRRPSSRQAS